MLSNGNRLDKPPVSALWIGPKLSVYEQLSLRSFLRSGHPVTLYAYDRVKGVPNGIEVINAETIVPREAVFRNPDSPTFAMFSNLFRYEMIAKTGSTWIDADLIKLNEPLPDSEYLFAYESETHINNGLVRAPRESELIERLIAGTQPMLSPSHRDVPWGTYGPRLLTQHVHELGLDKFSLSAAKIYPVHYADIGRLFSADHRDREWCSLATRGSMTLHLWNKFLAESGQKQRCPHPQSFLGSLMAENGIAAHEPYVNPEAIYRCPTVARRGINRVVRHVQKLSRWRMR